MVREDEFCVVFMTASSLEEARKIAGGLVEENLAACVNLFPRVESIYRWEGKIENTEEIFLMAKTSVRKMEALERFVKSRHSYTVPEILCLPITSGSAGYLDWLQKSVS